MQIVEIYSHLNGLEYLLVHQKRLWKEIQDVIGLVNAEQCKTKVSREKKANRYSISIGLILHILFSILEKMSIQIMNYNSIFQSYMLLLQSSEQR